ncbi:MAG TPA: T9SS type A sorting domain-containing protein [Candidatus Marinimicrobia bacterium]|nr:T9SS type A sorting domain-containing protein [Candidatus Neomarinimicrobiota bacterium]
MKKHLKASLFILLVQSLLSAQPWVQNDAIFNPSGVPSLMFSQPRFADIDGDGDYDLILGHMHDKPLYLENIGTKTSPGYQVGEDIFSMVSSLDAEVAVMADINNDGKDDLISGGYTGLHLYKNVGLPGFPMFIKEEGYFSGINAGSYPIPDLGDVNNDGLLDLVLGFSENGMVKIYFNIGNDSIALFSESNSQIIGDVGLYAYPVFCDLDGDGDLDIAVGKDGSGLVYYKNIGTVENGNWQADASVFSGIAYDTYFNSPAIVDLNGDGKQDLIYGSGSGPLNYFRNSGTVHSPAWTRNTSVFGGVLDVGGASSPFFYDYDGDGDLDMFSGSNLGDIKYYENTGTIHAPTWKEKSSSFTSLKHSIYSSVTIGDVNNDSLPDAIVGDLSGNLYLHMNTGTGFTLVSDALSHIALGGWSVPRLVDFDEDGDLDIVAGNETGNLFYFENQGTPENPDWVEIPDYFNSIDVGWNCVPTIADFTGNGRMDVLTGTMWRELKFFTFQDDHWAEDTTYFSGIPSGQNTAPALVDLDGDGDYDLVLGCYEGTFSYFENRSVVSNIHEEEVTIPDFSVYNYPNPFNATTTIEFSLPISSTVLVKIVDLKGREIRSWSLSQMNMGVHTLHWDGCMNNGAHAGSGMYIYHIRTKTGAKTGKMLLLK